MDIKKDPFLLHMLMDGNIADNIGGNGLVTFSKFIGMCKKFIDKTPKTFIERFGTPEYISGLYKLQTLDTVDFQKFYGVITNGTDSIKWEGFGNNAEITKTDLMKYLGEELETIKNIIDISPAENERLEKKSLMDSITMYTTRRTMYVEKMMEPIIRVICNAAIFMKVFSDDIFIPSGWTGYGTESGHLVGMYLKHTGGDRYTVVITNSGAGLNRHPSFDGKYRIINEIHDVDRITSFKLLCLAVSKLSILQKELLSLTKYNDSKNSRYMEDPLNKVLNIELESIYTYSTMLAKRLNCVDVVDEDVFYNGICNSFKKKYLIDINFVDNVNYYHHPQISGSCTYYGIYYFLMYLFFKENAGATVDNFHNIYRGIQLTLCDELIGKTLDKYDTNDGSGEIEYITEESYDIIYNLICKFKTDGANLYTKYFNRLHSIYNRTVDNYNGRFAHTIQDISIQTITGKDTVLLLPIIEKARSSQHIIEYLSIMCELIKSMQINIEIYKKDHHGAMFIGSIYDTILFDLIIRKNREGAAFYMIKEEEVDNVILHAIIIATSLSQIGMGIIIENFPLYVLHMNMVIRAIDPYIKLEKKSQYCLGEEIYSQLSYFYSEGDLHYIRVYFHIMKTNTNSRGKGNKVDDSYLSVWNHLEKKRDRLLFLLFNIKRFKNDILGRIIGKNIKKYTCPMIAQANRAVNVYGESYEADNVVLNIDKPSYIYGDIVDLKQNGYHMSAGKIFSILPTGTYEVSGKFNIVSVIDFYDDLTILKDNNENSLVTFGKWSRIHIELVKTICASLGNDTEKFEELYFKLGKIAAINFSKPNDKIVVCDDTSLHAMNFNPLFIVDLINNNNYIQLKMVLRKMDFPDSMMIEKPEDDAVFGKSVGGSVNVMNTSRFSNYCSILANIETPNLIKCYEFLDAGEIIMLTSIILLSEKNITDTQREQLIEIINKKYGETIGKDNIDEVVAYSPNKTDKPANQLLYLQILLDSLKKDYLSMLKRVDSSQNFGASGILYVYVQMFISKNINYVDRLINIYDYYLDTVPKKYPGYSISIASIQNKKFYKLVKDDEVLNLLSIEYLPHRKIFEHLGYTFKYMSECGDDCIVCISDNTEGDKLRLTLKEKNVVIENLSIGEHKYVCVDTNNIPNIQVFTLLSRLRNITDNIFVWFDDIDNIYKIDLPFYNHDENIVRFTIHGDKIYFRDKLICTDVTIFNRLVFGIPNAFILNSDNKFSLLLISTDKFGDKRETVKLSIAGALDNIWLKTSNNDKKSDTYTLYYSYNSVFLFDLHYTGLRINLPSIEGLLTFFIECNNNSKTHTMSIIFDSINKFSLSNEQKNMLMYVNSLYSKYFLVKLHPYRKKYIYSLELRRDHYIDKYMCDNMTPGEIRLTPDKLISYVNNLISSGIIKNMPVPKINEGIVKLGISKYFSFTDKKQNSGEYVQCRFKSKKEFDDALKNFDGKILNVKEIFESIKDIDSNRSIIRLLIEYGKLYYDILSQLKINEALEKLHAIGEDIKKSNDVDACNKSISAVSAIDSFYVCTAPRNTHESLFELMFGNLIRSDQYSMIKNILNGIHKGNYDINQMLMGKGKTSVITPLIVLHIFYTMHNINNVVIVLPKHLIPQSFDMFSITYGSILLGVKINNMEIRRETSLSSGDNFFSSPKTLNITDLSSLQSLLLNYSSSGRLPFDREKTVFIFDELDSLSDPLSNELNYPTSVKEKTKYYRTSVNIICSVIDNLRLQDIPVLDDVSRKQYIDKLVNFVPTDDAKLNYVYYKIKKVLNIALQKLYNKDYGFSSDDNIFVAIPYSAVRTPINGSEFTDIDIKLIFTYLTYKFGGLRLVDSEKIKSLLAAEYKRNFNTYSKNKLAKIVDGGNVSNIRDIYDIKIDRKNSHLIRYYFENVIAEGYIIKTDKQLNCSFIDIAGNKFSKYKIGFSGTVDLINIETIKEDTGDYKFNDINPDDVAMGSIYSAYIGASIYDNFREINRPNIVQIDYEKDLSSMKLDDILGSDISKYNALIDAGAIFKEYSPEKVVDAVKKKTNFEKYIYFDSTHRPVIINNDNGKGTFIYYDHQHTIGMDYKQDYRMDGLVTINYFNRFTDVSQAMYRLRNLNYGHFVDFIIYGVNEKIDTGEQLLHYLLQKDSKYKKNTETHSLLQQIKYLGRNSSYEETVYDEIDHIKTDEDIGKDLFISIFTKKYINTKSIQINKMLSSLEKRGFIENLLNTNTNIIEEISSARSTTRSMHMYDHKSDDFIKNNQFPKIWGLTDFFSRKKIKDIQYPDDNIRILNQYDIYLSPSMYQLHFDVDETSIPYYNYSFIDVHDGDDNFAVIVRGWEASILYSYIQEKNIEARLCDKNGDFILSGTDKLCKYQTHIIRYIIGGFYNITDTFNICKLLTGYYHNTYGKIYDFLSFINLRFAGGLPRDSVGKLIRFCDSKHTSPEKILKDSHLIKEYINTIDTVDPTILIDELKKSRILQIPDDQIGGNSYYYKYKKYKSRYLESKK